ncbi:DNA/RNA polymerase [Aspergillus heteromorphus CBS 117.55]|uniref:DNA/RNA polymerase n=1 Tax=Aspergillus heteromorphus CBS 117.55 TaxID=1448321 RepID=A0A317WPP3_9EURO|nr:DNA/RNA polymerase [Aspergillus heteromorphus CBS 117.55]PWY87621.1 DNA/RNA polymerase [Aspergillus heteromorphus CBS 117.55]
MAVAPSRDDRRIILHFDYDCFYASVFEAEQPVLKTLPLAVQQKQIVVTCNYEARRRGLRKLQLIREARQICPDVVIVLGEDLSKFRDVSKALFLFLRSFVWGGNVERLGFDEVFLDVTEMIRYNVDLLNRHDLEHSFFHLDRQEPTVGFTYDATRVHGSTYPGAAPSTAAETAESAESAALRTRLLVASHLAGFLRAELEHRKGYTATVGIATSKLLAKLAGSTHKPNNQTTLLPPYVTVRDRSSNVHDFLDAHEIRQIPGLGSKLTAKLVSYLAGARADGATPADRVTVRDVRLAPGMGPARLDRILGGPGAPRDIGARVWGLINGVDNSEVAQTGDLPTQISIEDSYGRLDSLEAVRRALDALAASLLRRMRTDLTEPDETGTESQPRTRWLARPRTLRLSTRPRSANDAQSYQGNRISRSAPVPSYVFHLDESVDAIAERLVQEVLLAMFRRLHPEKSGWNLRLMNVAVTNLVEAAGDRKQSSGRDIGKMFQSQGSRMDVVSDMQPSLLEGSNPSQTSLLTGSHGLAGGSPRDADPNPIVEEEEAAWEDSDEEESMPSEACGECGILIPHFAREAHELYHAVPD